MVGVLIAIGAINLYLLFESQISAANESNSIIRAGDLKVKAETVSSLARSIAAGNEEERAELEEEISEIESVITTLRKGGQIRNQAIVPIPSEVVDEYQKTNTSWLEFKNTADDVQETSVFDQEVVESLNYVLEKNADLILVTDSVSKEISTLDRDYKRHKEISEELVGLAKKIGQDALLISIGEEDVQKQLENHRLQYEAGLKKLLQIPLEGINTEEIGVKDESLIPIPRENSESLRKLDPLWEAIRLRILTLENKPVLSPDFITLRNDLEDKKQVFFDDIDQLLDSWNANIAQQRIEQQRVVQGLLGIDIVVFVLVVVIVRQSLNPLNFIIRGLSRVKEGFYGEKVEYSGKDEVKELVDTFNLMSDTIKEKEEEARRNDLAKDEFLAMITHELKTPLVPIQGYADLLLSEHLGKLTAKQRERLQIIKTSAASLLEIISDLLDAQKLELGQLRMRKEPSNIKETIENAVTSFDTELEKNNIKISTNLEDIQVSHDQERIKQVLSNLIKNSINAVKPGVGEIQVESKDKGDHVEVSVQDNGVGIATDKQDGLFKKFYQVDASLTREKGGSGLGLAICKGIIENHGGKITVQSAPHQGSTFTFTLPKENKPVGGAPIS
ncbi:MAG: HAMP domain-containing protein [Nitrosopumilaceae archaeon]|nr:HAMP domain-containing histidine kinase [Nitrosopumilaceae archaeon]NIU00597.1 HAMP domain-containing histidine kinase [Nitrosopumilaceae archaeon]NIU86983.1 HAMP domain-containing protein [Nitrosopumilaceae archaeon]NIV66447.1 HAMP domain-containing protein [Nitrosopumilaceae archaeon]NIX61199.1 HAMP domain-containing protein [Nitrosopumilaceae archaeon]